MSKLILFITTTLYRHPDPANDPSAHAERVNAAREQMGSSYLCHPDNRVKSIWRGPV